VVVQAIDPPPSYPSSQTVQQLLACQAAGLHTEAYVYLWTSNSTDITRQLGLLQGLGVQRVWLDCEDTTAATPLSRVRAIGSGLAQIAAAGYAAGIYTGRWWWTQYAGDPTDWASLPLWASIYDGKPDLASGFVPFGGWQEVTMKQYSGTSSLGGIGGIDLDAT
jgi:glycosyl hydrolase family 25